MSVPKYRRVREEGLHMEESATTRKFTLIKVGKVVTLVGSIVSIGVAVLAYIQPGRSVEGTWTLKTQTENIREARFRDMELRYRVNLTVDGTHVTGNGYKLGEKLAGGKYRPDEGKTRPPFDIAGNLDLNSDSLEVWFTEEQEGEQSTTDLKLEKNVGSWAGTFKSDRATSSGKASLSRF